MPEQGLVSVIIPTHQRRDELGAALRSFVAQTADPGSFEVVVAIDGSTDGTAELLESFDTPFGLRSVEGPQRGRAGACNAAIAAARGEILIVLDDDMEPVPEFIERHRAHHPPGSRQCVLGAVPVAIDASSTAAARHVRDRFAAHLGRLGDAEHRNRPRSFYSGNASLRTEVMQEAGGFDESFTAYGNEDVELALRLRSHGVAIEFDPEALARQHYNKGLRGLAEDTFAKGGTTVQLARARPEVFADLRLASPNEHSRSWLSLRAVLLAATRRRPSVARAVFGAATLLERLGLSRQPLFYRAVDDYAFWAGAAGALRASDGGDLCRLADELHRGPIDLLLHR